MQPFFLGWGSGHRRFLLHNPPTVHHIEVFWTSWHHQIDRRDKNKYQITKKAFFYVKKPQTASLLLATFQSEWDQNQIINIHNFKQDYYKIFNKLLFDIQLLNPQTVQYKMLSFLFRMWIKLKGKQTGIKANFPES